MRKFSPLLRFKKTTAFVDHASLEKLLEETEGVNKTANSRLWRWDWELQSYPLKIRFRPGALNPTDKPSRNPANGNVEPSEEYEFEGLYINAVSEL